MIVKRRLLKGVTISSGIVLGHARVVNPGAQEIADYAVPVSRVKAEIALLDAAVDDAVGQLKALRETAGKKMSGALARIFDAQLLIASDAEFLSQVKSEVEKKRRNVASIYDGLIQNTIIPLRDSPEPYLRQMVQDVEAVATLVLSHFTSHDKCELKFAPNTILVGKLFTPGDILSFRERKAVGFLVGEGGRNSHMSLIARALMLPVMMIEMNWARIPNNCRVIIDGINSEVVVHPTDDDLVEYQKRKRRHGPALISRIKSLKVIPPRTRDGKELEIAANLSLPGPADDILSARKIPIGLYRTEFLFLTQGSFPDEETQYEYYLQIARKFADTPVTLRTFDLGYDKLSTHTFWPAEENPALGWRGIRPMLDMIDVLKTQVRAILRASVAGRLRIMLPMISDLSELEKAQRLISQVKFSLRKEKIEFDPTVPVGIMIEVPSAALTAPALARKADFISIGTNDLTQYTLAADRMNSKVAHLYSALHPSVLSLIHSTIQACHVAGTPVSICGEIAGDMRALPLFIGMGVDQLSINPNRIVDLCRQVRKIDSSLVRHLVNSVVDSGSLKEVNNKLARLGDALNF